MAKLFYLDLEICEVHSTYQLPLDHIETPWCWFKLSFSWSAQLWAQRSTNRALTLGQKCKETTNKHENQHIWQSDSTDSISGDISTSNCSLIYQSNWNENIITVIENQLYHRSLQTSKKWTLTQNYFHYKTFKGKLFWKHFPIESFMGHEALSSMRGTHDDCLGCS